MDYVKLLIRAEAAANKEEAQWDWNIEKREECEIIQTCSYKAMLLHLIKCTE